LSPVAGNPSGRSAGEKILRCSEQYLFLRKWQDISAPLSAIHHAKKTRCVCKNNVIGLILPTQAITNEVKKAALQAFCE
jgi:hypothetical protein